jgi:hypothetical protein
MPRVSDIVAWLHPREIPSALRLIALMEAIDQISRDEAAEWRQKLEAYQRFYSVKLESPPNA